MKNLSLSQIRQTAAEILASAVLELCPDAHIIEGRPTFSGFSYQFLFPSPFSKEMLPFIEERMRKTINEDLPIEHKEMVPDNASAFFRHYPRHYPSIFAKEQKGPLVDIFQIRGFADLCPGPYAKSTGEIGVVKLLSVQKKPAIKYRGEEKPVFEIEGVVCETPKKLKEFLKRRKEFLEREHRNLGKSLSLFLIQSRRGKDFHEVLHCFWLREGEKLKRDLHLYWKELHEEKGFNIVQTEGTDLLKNHTDFFDLSEKNLKNKVWKVAEFSRMTSDEGMDPWKGLINSKDYYFERAHIFCLEEALKEELISSLQFLEKTSKMLSFESTLVVFIPRKGKDLYLHLKKACEEVGLKYEERQGKLAKVVWKITDRNGEPRSSSFIELRRREKEFVITHSLFNRLERFVALLMEAEGPSFEKRMKYIAKKRNFE